MKFYVKTSYHEGSEVYDEYKDVFDCYKTEILYDIKYFNNIGYLVIEFNSLEDVIEFESKINESTLKNKIIDGIIISNPKDSDFPKMNYPTIEIYDGYRE